MSASKHTADVIIIGAGIIGTSTALHLARAGRKIIVIDKLAGPGLGSTSYSSGICRMFYSVLDSVKFSWEGYQYFTHWEDFIGTSTKDSRGYAKLRECGGMVFQSKSTEEWVNKMVPLFEQVGVPHEKWDRKKLDNEFGLNSPFRMDFSSFGPPKRIDHEDFGTPVPNEEVTGALWVDRSGYVSDPNLAVLNMVLACETTENTTFLYGHSVTKILRNDTDTKVTGVELSDGTLVSAPVVVNVAGPHSNQITDLAFNEGASKLNDMTITTKALRQEVAYVNAPPGMSGADHAYERKEKEGKVTLPMMGDVDAGIYFRPEVGGKILMGTTEPECDHPLEYVEDPDNMNQSLTDNHTNYMYRLALRIPEIRLPGSSDTQGIVACYDVTEDWTPIYDKSLLGGYYMAIGTSGNQFKNAGVAGALMCELIEKCENKKDDWDHDVEPLQFKLKYTGGTVDTKSFSRKRQVLDTTASVLG